MNKKLPIRLRKAVPEDVPFIFNSWLKSFRNAPFALDVTNTTYYTEHHKVIEKILHTGEVIMACNDQDPSQLYGYICATKIDSIFCLHYIYVKHPYRNLGLGKTLLNAFEHDPAFAGVYTHYNRISGKLAAKYNMVYHPYILMNDYLQATQPVVAEEVENEQEDSKDNE